MCLLLLSLRLQWTCMLAILCFSTCPVRYVCVYMSTWMNAYMQACERTFGLWVTDPFAGVNVCVRACRHGQSTAVMTGTSPVSFLCPHSISGFSSSSSLALSLSLTVVRTGNICLIGKISEASASC